MGSPITPLPWRTLHRAVQRLDLLLARWEGPQPLPEHHFDRYRAFRWEARPAGGVAREQGVLLPVPHPQPVALDDLLGIDGAKERLLRNTHQFTLGLPANNALLWGSRGTGKSSLVKAVAAHFAPLGLKLVEVQRDDLLHLPAILAELRPRPHPFLLFCDDLSFARDEGSYKALKAVLEGGVEARPANVLLYVTSNRRHLMPRSFDAEQGERHPAESGEEQISLSDRFGLWLGFHAITQPGYLAIVRHYAQRLDWPLEPQQLEREALDWARTRGAMSGRVARQFMDDLAGRLALAGAARRPAP